MRLASFALAATSLFTLASPSPLHAQSSPDLLDRLHSAAITDSLASPGAAPFHLKATIQLDAQYRVPAQQGTIEIWFSAPETQRIVYDFPSYQATSLQTPTGRYRTPEAASPPYLVTYLVDQLLHPLPLTFDSSKFTATVRQQQNGNTTLDCIFLNRSEATPPLAPSARQLTYCLESTTLDLRVTSTFENQITTREKLGILRDRRSAMQLSVIYSGKPSAHLHVDLLNGQAAPYPQTSDTTGLNPVLQSPVSVPGSGIAGKILHKEVPNYPRDARLKHISGTVVLHAIIGIDGKISNLQVIGSPSDLLSQAATDAVRQWTYTPYLLNGQPTEVDTTIDVNFNLAHP